MKRMKKITTITVLVSRQTAQELKTRMTKIAQFLAECKAIIDIYTTKNSKNCPDPEDSIDIVDAVGRTFDGLEVIV